eukprot:gene26602-5108_t
MDAFPPTNQAAPEEGEVLAPPTFRGAPPQEPAEQSVGRKPKRQVSEKQRAHLQKIRALAIEARKRKALEKSATAEPVTVVEKEAEKEEEEADPTPPPPPPPSPAPPRPLTPTKVPTEADFERWLKHHEKYKSQKEALQAKEAEGGQRLNDLVEQRLQQRLNEQQQPKEKPAHEQVIVTEKDVTSDFDKYRAYYM